MKKKITIDILARMTQDEFSRMGKRFDKIDERFDDMDTRFYKMGGTLKTILDVVLEIPSKKKHSNVWITRFKCLMPD